MRSARAARGLFAGAASLLLLVLVLALGAAVVLGSALGVELVLEEVPLVAGAPELGVMPEPEVA